MKISKKIPMLIAGMIVALSMMCFVGSTALAADETVTAYVYSETDFRSFIGIPAVDIINVSADFDLTADVTIDRKVEITSATGSAIDVKSHSIIIDNGGDVTVSGDTKVTGSGGSANQTIKVNGGAVSISGGVIEATGTGRGVSIEGGGIATISDGVIEARGIALNVSDDGTANISGGVIKAIGSGGNGVRVEDGGTVNMSSGVIKSTEQTGLGVLVRSDGTAEISGGHIIAMGNSGIGVRSSGVNSTTTISGGVIEATGSGGQGVLVDGGSTVSISGGTISAMGDSGTFGSGVYITGSNSRTEINGTAQISSNDYGVYVGGNCSAEISGNVQISGTRYGVYVRDGTASITIASSLSPVITNGVYGYESIVKAFLTTLPEAITMTATESYDITIEGVDPGVGFALDPATSNELNAQLNNDGNGVTMSPQAEGSYNLLLTSQLGTGYLHLTIPVTVLPKAVEPAITQQPEVTTVNIGETATFTVAATAPDNGDLTYQWQKSTDNGVSWDDIAGAVNTVYTTGDLDFTNNGNQYRCLVTNEKNSTTATVTSGAAILTVNPAVLPTYTVTYHGNNTSGTVPVDSSSYTSGSTVTVLDNTGNLTRTGYSFTGWRDGSTNYAPGDTFTITDDVTLNARWTAISGGGSSGGGGGSSSGTSGSSQEKPQETEEKEEASPPQKNILLTIGKLDITLDDEPHQLDAMPFIDRETNRTLVPLRFISEALGAEVTWLPDTRQILIKDGDIEILLTIGSKEVLVNGEIILVDTEPRIMPPGRTFVPLRFVSEVLGAIVEYDEVTREISIEK